MTTPFVPVLLSVALMMGFASRRPAARVATLLGQRECGQRPKADPDRLVSVTAGVAAALLAVALVGAPAGLVVGPAVGLLGYRLFRRVRRSGFRRRRLDPDAPLRLASSWDLLAACLRAGLPVPAAVRSIATDLPGEGSVALCRTAELIALGADPDEAWEPALRCPETAPLARGARRSARSGMALADIADALAAEVRAHAGDAAEARAQRAAVLVAGPLGLCFLPAFLCLGVVPVVIGLASTLVSNW